MYSCSKRYFIFVWISTFYVVQNSGQDLGQPCNTTVLCRPQNSQCVSGFCSCAQNYQKSSINSYTCLPVRDRIDTDCSESVQCSAVLGPGVWCYYGICTCRTGYVRDQSNTRCVRAAHLNERCYMNDPICVGQNIICGASGVCTCIAGFQPSNYNNSLCIPGIRQLYENCTETQHCLMSLGENTVCTNNTCQCRDGYGASSDLTRCYRASRLDDACDNINECQAGVAREHQYRVECNNRKCVCKENFTASLDRARCNEWSKLNESCEESAQCSSTGGDNAICFNGTCACKDGYGPGSENICYKISKLGDNCSQVEECYLGVLTAHHPNTDCVENTCVCKENFTESRDRTKCYDSSVECDDERPCEAENTTCEQGVCVCVPGFLHTSHNRSFCVREPRKLYENCTENIHCSTSLGDSSVCMNGTCKCQSGYAPSANFTRCVEIPKPHKLYENCTENIHCSTSLGDSSVCMNGTCKCQSGYAPSANFTRCVEIPKSKVSNTTCTESSNCTVSFGEHSLCRNGTCVCQNGYAQAANYTYCIKIAKLGDNCSHVDECHLGVELAHHFRVECSNSKCTCKKNFTASADRVKCNGAGISTVTQIVLILSLIFTKIA